MEYVTHEGIIVTNRIFVGSIPDWMGENKLHLAFQDLNFDVQDTRIVVDMRTGQRKGYGFVTFHNPSDAAGLVKKGFVITKDGVRLKVDTAVRRKGLQLRLQKQMSSNFFQYGMNTFTPNTGIYPVNYTSQAQLQMPYVYPVVCGCPMQTSYQPVYQDYTWQNQAFPSSHTPCVNQHINVDLQYRQGDL